MKLDAVDKFIGEVDSALNVADVFASLRREIGRMGFEYYTYEVTWPTDGPREQFWDSTFRSDWLQRYGEQRYQSHDLICTYAAQTVRPFQWTEICDPRHLTDQQRLIFNEGAEAGLKSGGTVPIHGPGAARAYVTVAGSISGEEFTKLFVRWRHEIFLLSVYAHERIVALKQRKNPEPSIKLSPHEVEILSWTAQGKTSDEIGSIVGSSANTVNKHVQNICRKLGVNNKIHAVATALSQRLILG